MAYFNEWLNVVNALGVVIFSAHFLALVLEQLLRLAPFQQTLLLAAIVEQVHAKSDVHAHGLECLFARLAINDIIPHVERILHFLEIAVGEQPFHPRVGMLLCCGSM